MITRPHQAQVEYATTTVLTVLDSLLMGASAS